MKFDFLARQGYLLDHLAPLWNELPEDQRGEFFVLGSRAQELAESRLKGGKVRDYLDEGPCGSNHIIVASYGDSIRAKTDPKRHVILMEHGIGLTFGKAAYADGLGQRALCSLIPVQSQYIANKVHPDLKHIPHPIIGVPKLDKWFKPRVDPIMPKKPTIAFAFHHGDKFSRPGGIGSAWEHYVDMFPLLPLQYRWIFHAHPASNPRLLESLKNWGLEYVEDLETVFNQADILINDCGSSAYEFCTTGKPVILLNAPWFDKKTQYGIRFWDYANIGHQVEGPDQLESIVDRVVQNPQEHLTNRNRMMHDLMPYGGMSTQRAIAQIQSRFEQVKATVVPTSYQQPVFPMNYKIRTSDEQGILFMAFGEAAQTEMEKCIKSLRDVGSTLPVAVVGESTSTMAKLIPWQGPSPFDATKPEHFQFRAGRVKPFLYDLSPFKQTLYVDCDVEFLQKPDEAFGFLRNWDFVIAQERLSLAQLYNQRGSGWEHDLAERDFTVEDFGGGSGEFPFWNSGVFFWRQNRRVKRLFELWYQEWKRFEGWDEQKALMRAGNHADSKVLVLSEIWNYPHRHEMKEKVNQAARIILHEYGRGAARTDIGAQ